MKFTVVLFAALALASAIESESSKNEGIVPKQEVNADLFHKLTKWFSINLPSIFAPIRTTPKPTTKPAPKPTAAPAPKPTAAPAPRPTTAPAPKPTAAPSTAAPAPPSTAAAPAPAPSAAPESAASTAGSDPNPALSQDIQDALDKVYQSEALKPFLPAKEALLKPDPQQQAAFQQAMAVPFKLLPDNIKAIIKSIGEYIVSLQGRAPDFKDPVPVEFTQNLGSSQ